MLGHGSGFDSPGCARSARHTRRSGRPSTRSASARAERRGVYVRGREHEVLYQLGGAEEWDERISMWRVRHYKVVARVIGDSVVGTQGTPVEVSREADPHNLLPRALAARGTISRRFQGT